MGKYTHEFVINRYALDFEQLNSLMSDKNGAYVEHLALLM